jgi:hypothetical protein
MERSNRRIHPCARANGIISENKKVTASDYATPFPSNLPSLPRNLSSTPFVGVRVTYPNFTNYFAPKRTFLGDPRRPRCFNTIVDADELDTKARIKGHDLIRLFLGTTEIEFSITCGHGRSGPLIHRRRAPRAVVDSCKVAILRAEGR